MSGPTRVLVVDDEQSITDFIALGLRHEGFEVRTASDGHVALRAVDEFNPHLVVLDERSAAAMYSRDLGSAVESVCVISSA